MERTILLVEDNENDVLFMKLAFEEVGITVPMRIAEDGREALAYLSGSGKFKNRDQYPLPYLVLLDLKLPYVMGLDVLKWIRERPEYDAMILVVLSTSANPSDVAEAYRLRANAYLVKPSGLDKLQRMAESIKEFWLVQNQPAGVFCNVDI